MPKTLERVTLPQPHSSCWQPLGCLSSLCWTGIAGSNTSGRQWVTGDAAGEALTGGSSSSPGLPGQLRAGKGLAKWPGLLLVGKGQGRRAGQERKDSVRVWPWTVAQGRVIKAAFCHGRKWCDYSFWIKKWELLWCLQAWETYLHALPSGTLPPFPSWVLSHFSYHGSVLARKPSDGPLLSSFIPSWTTLCLPLGKALSSSLWQLQQLLKSSPEGPSSNPVVSVKKMDSSLPWQIQKHRKK